MKKKLIILLLITTSVNQLIACDVCGCSLGGNYFGILPLFDKNFIGLRWSQAKFHSYVDESDYLGPEWSHDTYSRIEFLGRFYVNKKIQLFAFVPFNYNSMNGNEQVISSQGLGDISVMANYLLINTGEMKVERLRHSLMIGGGIKIPTGTFSLEDNGKLVNPNFQMGSGSTDFLLSMVYTLRYRKIGLSNEAGYKINTRNSNDYIFGNQFHASSRLFYWQSVKSFSFLPNAGIYYERANEHRDGYIIQANTGGSALLATAGLQTTFKRFNVGIDYQLPLAQRYNSDDVADIQSKERWTVSCTFNF